MTENTKLNKVLAPDTLDLVERGRLGINGLIGTCDPERHYEPYFLTYYDVNPAYAIHWSSMVSGVQPKYMEALCLLRAMIGTGSFPHEQGFLKAILDNVKDDGLVYDRALPERPWNVVLGYGTKDKNADYANIFYRLKLIEGYGTGIQNIMESYEKSRQHPSFLPGPASFVVVLPNMNIHDKIQFDGSLTHDENVMNFVKERGEVTRKDVETFLSCSQFPAFKALSRLVEEGKIMKVGAARSTKYRLH